MFTPIREKLNTLIPDAKEIDAFNHFSTIVERMIVNGHAAHKTIPGYDKCKFPRRGRVKKDGTRSWSTTKLPETIEPYHLMQTDFYHYATELPIYICYINEESFKVFSAENCELLTPKSIESRKKDFIQRCKVRQNLMKISNDVNVLKDYIQPDFENYFWRNDLDPTYLDNAKKFWSS